MNKNDLVEINDMGHTIGLHSHSHPTLMEKLSEDEQFAEYDKNIRIIKKEIGCEILACHIHAEAITKLLLKS